MKYVVKFEGQYLAPRLGYWERCKRREQKKPEYKWVADLQKARVFASAGAARQTAPSSLDVSLVPVVLKEYEA